MDATSERVKAGLDRAKAEGKKLGRPPALTPEQVLERRRMYAETPSIRRVARILGCPRVRSREPSSSMPTPSPGGNRKCLMTAADAETPILAVSGTISAAFYLLAEANPENSTYNILTH